MKKKSTQKALALINANAAGIDIGSTFHYVAVPEDRDEQPVRRFESFTQDLHELAHWLKECGIRTVAMESTGIYWLQLFVILEQEGFEVYLVNARHVKNVSGRKSDVLDCQWIQQLHSYGLLSASFQPDELTRSLRGYMRHRKHLTESYAKQVLHMQKAFEQMNIKLHTVLTDITGKSGMAIIRAILAGQRDAHQLAQLVDGRVRSSEEQIVKSLEAHWQEEPLFELKQAYELYLCYKGKIAECDTEIEKALGKFRGEAELGTPQNKPRKVHSKNRLNFDAGQYLQAILGVDVTQMFGISEVLALEIVSEVGTDMRKWPTKKHFTAWLNLAPNNRISGGKLLRSKRQKKKNKAAQAFLMAAYALQRSDHWLGAFYRRMKARQGALVATKATARKLATIFYHMVKEQVAFHPIPVDQYEQELAERKRKYVQQQAAKMGMALVPI